MTRFYEHIMSESEAIDEILSPSPLPGGTEGLGGGGARTNWYPACAARVLCRDVSVQKPGKLHLLSVLSVSQNALYREPTPTSRSRVSAVGKCRHFSKLYSTLCHGL